MAGRHRVSSRGVHEHGEERLTDPITEAIEARAIKARAEREQKELAQLSNRCEQILSALNLADSRIQTVYGIPTGTLHWAFGELNIVVPKFICDVGLPWGDTIVWMQCAIANQALEAWLLRPGCPEDEQRIADAEDLLNYLRGDR